VRGTDFGDTTARGFTAAQLYSTASYQAHDLTGINLVGNDLSGWNFAGQNLSNSSFAIFSFTGGFASATLTGADFTAADARGASLYSFLGSILADAITTNMILPGGDIDGLNLDTGGLLVVRNYRDRSGNPTPVPITVGQHLAMAPGGALRMVFEADAWDSTISFAPGIPVTLGG
jgi:hypothetical protein